MVEPLVTVIIPTRNMAEYISESIENVLKQTHRNLQIIVVDDDSTDDTDKLVTCYSQVQYIKIKHRGENTPAHAHNVGLTQAHGEYIICLAADDILHPEYITRCLTQMQDGVGFVWTGCQEFGGRHQIRMPFNLTRRFACYRGFGGQLGAMLVRKATYETVGGYDTSLAHYEDWDWAIRALHRGWKAKPISQVLHYRRIHNKSVLSKAHGNPLRRRYPLVWFFDYASIGKRKLLSLFKKKGVAPEDEWEVNRADERFGFGVDIGAGANKLLPIGCDIRRVSDLQCDMRYLPFRDKAFCISLLRHSLEHVAEWREALTEAQRVAYFTFVILPKAESWNQDPEHTLPFRLVGQPFKSFVWGECFVFQEANVAGSS